MVAIHESLGFNTNGELLKIQLSQSLVLGDPQLSSDPPPTTVNVLPPHEIVGWSPGGGVLVDIHAGEPSVLYRVLIPFTSIKCIYQVQP